MVRVNAGGMKKALSVKMLPASWGMRSKWVSAAAGPAISHPSKTALSMRVTVRLPLRPADLIVNMILTVRQAMVRIATGASVRIRQGMAKLAARRMTARLVFASTASVVKKPATRRVSLVRSTTHCCRTVSVVPPVMGSTQVTIAAPTSVEMVRVLRLVRPRVMRRWISLEAARHPAL